MNMIGRKLKTQLKNIGSSNKIVAKDPQTARAFELSVNFL